MVSMAIEHTKKAAIDITFLTFKHILVRLDWSSLLGIQPRTVLKSIKRLIPKPLFLIK